MGFVKNYWVSGIALVFIIACIVNFYEPISALANQHIFVLQILFVIFYFYLGLVRKAPTILVSPPSVLFMRGTRIFTIVIAVKIMLQLTTYALAVWIFWLLWNVSFSWLFFINAFASLAVCGLLSWSRYNGQYDVHFYIAVIAAESALIFAEPIIGIGFNVLLAILFILKKCTIDWAKYLESVFAIYKINAVAARSDFVQMQEIANEKSTRSKYTLPFSGTLIKRPLFAKHLLVDTLRLPFSNWLVMIVFYIASVLIYASHLIPQIELPLLALMTTLSVGMFSRQYASNLRMLKRKEKSGLFLPVSNWEILFSNMLMPCVIMLAINIGVYLLCQLSIVSFVIVNLLMLGFLILYFSFSLRFCNREKIADTTFYSLVAVIYFLLIMPHGIA